MGKVSYAGAAKLGGLQAVPSDPAVFKFKGMESHVVVLTDLDKLDSPPRPLPGLRRYVPCLVCLVRSRPTRGLGADQGVVARWLNNILCKCLDVPGAGLDRDVAADLIPPCPNNMTPQRSR